MYCVSFTVDKYESVDAFSLPLVRVVDTLDPSKRFLLQCWSPASPLSHDY